MRGRHVKMLSPSGPLWMASQFATHPWIWPLSSFALERAISAFDAVAPLSVKSRAEVFPALQRLTAEEVLRAYPAVATNTNESGGRTRFYRTPLPSTWGNMLGTLHGGASTMLGETAAAQAFCELTEKSEAPPATMLSVNLLSSLAVGGPSAPYALATVEIESGGRKGDARAPLPPRKALVSLRDPKRGAQAYEIGVWWDTD